MKVKVKNFNYDNYSVDFEICEWFGSISDHEFLTLNNCIATQNSIELGLSDYVEDHYSTIKNGKLYSAMESAFDDYLLEFKNENEDCDVEDIGLYQLEDGISIYLSDEFIFGFYSYVQEQFDLYDEACAYTLDIIKKANELHSSEALSYEVDCPMHLLDRYYPKPYDDLKDVPSFILCSDKVLNEYNLEKNDENRKRCLEDSLFFDDLVRYYMTERISIREFPFVGNNKLFKCGEEILIVFY